MVPFKPALAARSVWPSTWHASPGFARALRGAARSGPGGATALDRRPFRSHHDPNSDSAGSADMKDAIDTAVDGLQG